MVLIHEINFIKRDNLLTRVITLLSTKSFQKKKISFCRSLLVLNRWLFW